MPPLRILTIATLVLRQRPLQPANKATDGCEIGSRLQSAGGRGGGASVHGVMLGWGGSGDPPVDGFE
jgi:hypothetical protein